MPNDQLSLTVVIVVYNMRREAPRTLFTLTPEYQGISSDRYEVIVVDNGSDPPLGREVVEGFGEPFRYVHIEKASPSPAGALNLGAAQAKGRMLGFMIDGARMLTPGILQYAIRAERAYDHPVVSTMGFHLGPKSQQESVREGYNQDEEDRLLEKIDWQNQGYRLFEIGSFAPSCRHGWFAPIAESNCVFLNRADYEALDGFEEAFDFPGGGLVNLDFYRRALRLPGCELVVLLGEGAFHQYHGGATTRPAGAADPTWEDLATQYREIRGEAYQVDRVGCDFLGQVHPALIPSLQDSAELFLEYLSGNDQEIRPLPKINPLKPQAKSKTSFLAGRPPADEDPFQNWPSASPDHDSGGDVSLDDFPPAILEKLDEPVVFLARGGSGSRLLSSLAADIGVFTGNDINHSGDTLEMVQAIYLAVLSKFVEGTSWQRERIVPMIRRAAAQLLERKEPAVHWGFKVPEATLVAPEIERAFPRARYLHLLRDPLTTCLRRTHMTARFDNPIGRVVIPLAYRHCDRDPNESREDSPAIHMAYTTIHQIEIVREFGGSLPDHRYREIRFEDLLENPGGAVTDIARWLGNEEKGRRLAAEIDPQRAAEPTHKYPDEIEARVAEVLAPLRSELGYL